MIESLRDELRDLEKLKDESLAARSRWRQALLRRGRRVEIEPGDTVRVGPVPLDFGHSHGSGFLPAHRHYMAHGGRHDLHVTEDHHLTHNVAGLEPWCRCVGWASRRRAVEVTVAGVRKVVESPVRAIREELSGGDEESPAVVSMDGGPLPRDEESRGRLGAMIREGSPPRTSPPW